LQLSKYRVEELPEDPENDSDDDVPELVEGGVKEDEEEVNIMEVFSKFILVLPNIICSSFILLLLMNRRKVLVVVRRKPVKQS
jgi:hypothetical protein